MKRHIQEVNKGISLEELKSYFTSGMSLMVGGFGGVGNPPSLIKMILNMNIEDLTLICNDTGFPEIGVGQLITDKRVSTLYASHIGSNPNAGKQMTDEELIVHFFPQGTLAEKIRAGGVGLGGVLVDAGVGNPFVEKGQQTTTIAGQTYLIEPALTADVSIVYAKKADPYGNLIYDTSARNTNPLVAMAGRITIAEVEEIVPYGEIDPEEVVTSGVFVDYVVRSEGVDWTWAWEKK
ncbi:acyl CoA:acetate/3-ketoacid CoA transferase subunit alpha [Salipaludibacillus keqinensis]|uniref:Acyl CoA:acetate/3-ketoacid CoA transferase subunit alpha n=1 Tax=Salipaludibacillus keqinensis TaxID=2045207 RepID=A0A323TPS7_9BACI|nr:CoA transferase subunit A [Salipaludibacillus keqinensis]PYZ94593.1 acyl CoA:acetate/3-ketoacid CoA transferase subunit alpha [Salipaludibacillus keqinensis]